MNESFIVTPVFPCGNHFLPRHRLDSARQSTTTSVKGFGLINTIKALQRTLDQARGRKSWRSGGPWGPHLGRFGQGGFDVFAGTHGGPQYRQRTRNDQEISDPAFHTG